jgi:subtilisin family serine protease
MIQDKLGGKVAVKALKRLGQAADGTTLEVSVAATSEQAIRQAVDTARADKAVTLAEPVVLWRTHATVNDPMFSSEWHLQRISAPAAWNTTFGSRNVIVAVIDTGVDMTHPDLVGSIWTNPGEIPGNGVDDDHNGFVDDVHGWDFVSADASMVAAGDDPGPADADPSDGFGHGTAMAGVIGAQANNGIGVAGVAPGVTLMPVRAGFSDATHPGYGSFQSPDIAAAIRYAVNNGARIISMSFGGYVPSSLVGEAAQYADSKGVLLVASAGNDGVSEPTFPAAYGNVLATAALNSDDTWSSFSNFGTWVDVAAPGVDIPSLVIGGGYQNVSGTSPAAAIVSGVAALAATNHADWRKQQLRAQVLATVDEVASYPSLSDVTKPPVLGAGRVNAQQAVGQTPYSSHAYPLLVRVAENPGNGNQELNAGESALVYASWRVTAARTGLAARVQTTDPWLHVPSGTQTIAVGDDQVALAQFAVQVDSKTPADHVATLSIQLVDQWGLVDNATLKLTLEPSWRQLKDLEPSANLATVPMRNGSDMLLASTMAPAVLSRVYATIRKPSGAFTRTNFLGVAEYADYGSTAPAGVTDSNGNVHVAFTQLVAPDYAGVAFPAYARYQLATGTWTSPEFLGTVSGDTLISNGSHPTIGLDTAGRVHIAWPLSSSAQAIATIHQLADGSWSAEQRISITLDNTYAAQLKLLNVNGQFLLFVSNAADSAAAPLQIFQYNGTNWTGPTATGGAYASYLTRPFLRNQTAYRIYSPTAGGEIDVARFDRTSSRWIFTQQIAGATGLTLGELADATAVGTDTFATQLTYLTPNAAGHLKEMIFTGPSSSRTMAIPTDPDWLEKKPSVVADSSGNVHAFTQAWYHDTPGTTWHAPVASTYTTNAKLTGAAYPSIPVVVDDGATTTVATQLHASWRSTYSEGLTYRVAWGTAPGTDDVLPWQETTATDMVFDLNTRHLLPEQPVYATVVAESGSFPESIMGSSDGIRYVPPCTAASWNSAIVYQDPGMQVTYNGAMYQAIYWNSGTAPGGTGGPWQRVVACSGTPVLPACTATAWSRTQTYAAGVRVSYQGAEFQSSWSSTGLTPTGTNGNAWKWLNGCTP